MFAFIYLSSTSHNAFLFTYLCICSLFILIYLLIFHCVTADSLQNTFQKIIISLLFYLPIALGTYLQAFYIHDLFTLLILLVCCYDTCFKCWQLFIIIFILFIVYFYFYFIEIFNVITFRNLYCLTFCFSESGCRCRWRLTHQLWFTFDWFWCVVLLISSESHYKSQRWMVCVVSVI